MWRLYIVQFLPNCTGGYRKKKHSKWGGGGWNKLLFSSEVVTQADKSQEFPAGWWHAVPYVLKTIRPSRVSLMLPKSPGPADLKPCDMSLSSECLCFFVTLSWCKCFPVVFILLSSFSLLKSEIFSDSFQRECVLTNLYSFALNFSIPGAFHNSLSSLSHFVFKKCFADELQDEFISLCFRPLRTESEGTFLFTLLPQFFVVFFPPTTGVGIFK